MLLRQIQLNIGPRRHQHGRSACSKTSSMPNATGRVSPGYQTEEATTCQTYTDRVGQIA